MSSKSSSLRRSVMLGSGVGLACLRGGSADARVGSEEPLAAWIFQQERFTKYFPLYSFPRMSKLIWTSFPTSKASSNGHLSFTISNLRSCGYLSLAVVTTNSRFMNPLGKLWVSLINLIFPAASYMRTNVDFHGAMSNPG